MQDYTAMWSDLWKRRTQMQADIYGDWMNAWTRMISPVWDVEGTPGRKKWTKASDFYRQWNEYAREMMARLSVPTEGLSPETYFKMFESADVYSQLYSMWMDMYERYRELLSEDKELDFEAMSKVLDEWGERYRALVDKVFAPALPEQLRWIAELYSGEIPLMAAGMFTHFWTPWAEFSLGMMEKGLSGGKASPEAAVETYEEWRKAYEESCGRMLRTPMMGYYREAMEKYSHTMDSLTEFNIVMSEFYASLQSAGLKSVEKLQGRLADMQPEDADAPVSFREFYRLWWHTSEDIYVELFRTDEFSRLLGQLVDKGMQFRKDFQAYVEEATKELPFPNRTEMDHLYKTLHGLRREVRRLSRELKELKTHQAESAEEGGL